MRMTLTCVSQQLDAADARHPIVHDQQVEAVLIEASDGRTGTANSTGKWRLTKAGRRYVRGELAVPEFALVFDGKVRSFEGDRVTIREALGTRFSYEELMSAGPITPRQNPGRVRRETAESKAYQKRMDRAEEESDLEAGQQALRALKGAG